MKYQISQQKKENKSLYDYNCAAAWNQDRVDYILKILNKRKDFKGNDKEFSTAYKNRKILLEPEIYEKIPNMNPAWVKRYRRRFRECGIPGLLSGHGKSGPRRIKQKHRKFILRHLFENPYIRPIRVWEYLINEYGKVCDRRTVERFLKNWGDKNPEILATLRNPSKAKSKFRVSFGKADEEVNEYFSVVELDNTPGDVIDQHGRRFKIIACIDKFSRDVTALVSEVSSDISNNAMLRKLMIEKGIPQEIHSDNAREYKSKYFRAVCAHFNIKLPNLPPGAPEKRPYVERYFGTLTTSFFPELPGWCGANVSQRQNIRERGKFTELLKAGGEVKIGLTKEQLQARLDDWNKNIYGQKYHRGISCSPVEKIAGSTVKRVENVRDLDILLAPRDYRTVGKKGIQFQGGLFQSIDLAGLRIGTNVEIRQDLEDASRIYVFDEKGQFICIAHDSDLAGFTVDDYRAARKLQAEKRRKEIKALKDLPSVVETGMEALITASKAGPQIVPFIRHMKLEGQAVEEARKAAEAETTVQNNIAIELTDKKDFSYGPNDPAYRSRRYELLMQKYKSGEELNDEEMGFMKRFEKSSEYYLLYEAVGE